MEESNQSTNNNQGQETISPSSISRRNKTIILVLLSIIYFLNTAVFALLAPFFPQVVSSQLVKLLKTLYRLVVLRHNFDVELKLNIGMNTLETSTYLK